MQCGLFLVLWSLNRIQSLFLAIYLICGRSLVKNTIMNEAASFKLRLISQKRLIQNYETGHSVALISAEIVRKELPRIFLVINHFALHPDIWKTFLTNKNWIKKIFGFSTFHWFISGSKNHQKNLWMIKFPLTLQFENSSNEN